MSGNGSKVGLLTQGLLNQWQQTKESWSDTRSREFERHYIEELRASVDRAVTVIDQLDKLVAKIRSDCA